ncbi:MAG: hypothetical protein JWM14_3128 [Chitinophagaceae bacterium]|nr:hypothetical protein [Chitinophagaceae bacterium]
MKLSFTILILFLSFTFQSFGRNVMSWIPVYGIDNCKSMMNDATKSQWIKNGITHIGLQFWVPGDAGAVVFVTDYQFTWKAATISQDVQDFVTWCHANDVKIMMCFHNVRDSGFDWSYTQQVINSYPTQTVTSAMQVVNTYGLDGIDIDFEGVGSYASDKTAFVNFLNLLGTSLHGAEKELSVDMFPTPCYNFPNPSWESSMASHVDFMNIMGYDGTYEEENTKFTYCPETPSETNSYPFRYSYIENFLTVKQSVASSKLNYGLPSWQDSWGGQCLQENILDILDVSSAGGIAIWDLQLGGGGFWTNPVSWDLITMFKNNNTSAEIRAQLPICGIATAVADANNTVASMYYDAGNQLLHLPSKAGDLYLYSATGVLEKSWRINGEETVSFANKNNGFYLVKFETASGVYSERISLFK